MRSSASQLLPAFALLLAMPCFALNGSHTTHVKSSKHAAIKASAKSSKTHASVKAAAHITPGMPTERATEIQTALIQQGYLTGEPTGTWDASSQAAMQKLQGDNGWQTKITPDSRALIS